MPKISTHYYSLVVTRVVYVYQELHGLVMVIYEEALPADTISPLLFHHIRRYTKIMYACFVLRSYEHGTVEHGPRSLYNDTQDVLTAEHSGTANHAACQR